MSHGLTRAGRRRDRLDQIKRETVRALVGEIMRHHSAAFTLKCYAHAMPREWHHAVDMLDDAPGATIRNPGATEAPMLHVTS